MLHKTMHTLFPESVTEKLSVSQPVPRLHFDVLIVQVLISPKVTNEHCFICVFTHVFMIDYLFVVKSRTRSKMYDDCLQIGCTLVSISNTKCSIISFERV